MDHSASQLRLLHHFIDLLQLLVIGPPHRGGESRGEAGLNWISCESGGAVKESVNSDAFGKQRAVAVDKVPGMSRVF